jgi:hypothetical protein
MRVQKMPYSAKRFMWIGHANTTAMDFLEEY